MKRSKNAKLTLMVAGSALALSACGQNSRQHEAETYRSLDACKEAGLFSDAQCEASYNEALKVHEESAPRYNSERLCENDFVIGNCVQRTSNSGGVFWSPFMAGFLVSQILDRDNRSQYYSTSYYRGPRGRYYTWDGIEMRSSRGTDGRARWTVSNDTVKAKPKPAKVMTRTSVISRGGFGSRTSSRSSGRSWGG